MTPPFKKAPRVELGDSVIVGMGSEAKVFRITSINTRAEQDVEKVWGAGAFPIPIPQGLRYYATIEMEG